MVKCELLRSRLGVSSKVQMAIDRRRPSGVFQIKLSYLIKLAERTFISKFIRLQRVEKECHTLLFIKSTLFSVAASRIRYEITSGNIGGAFAVKNMTGAIYVAGALDYETRKRVGI